MRRWAGVHPRILILVLLMSASVPINAVGARTSFQSADPYVDRVVSFVPGTPASACCNDPSTVLGPPNFRENPLSGFLTLGVGGSLTVEFVDNIAVDGPGPDINVIGDPANDEQVTVAVSADGETFFSFGLVGESSELDLATLGVNQIRFVRIIDDGVGGAGGVSPGAEVDAVQALNSIAPGGSPPTPVPATAVVSPSASVVAPAPATATAAPPPQPSKLAWVRTGGPLGGLGYDVRMRPDNPDVMFVTDAWAGLFMSTDGGSSWVPSNTGITTRIGATGDGIPVFSVTIDPNNPATAWVGTQFQRGIFKSVDGGHTWKKMDNGIAERDGITFRGFTIQPGDSNIVYAAAEVSSWTWAGSPRTGREFDLTRGVIYKTTNGGQSWKAIWRGDNLARYIWINPQNPEILYISTGFFDREAANSDPKDPAKQRPGGEGILKSTDGGRTWTAVNNGLGNLYVTSLFMDPSNPDTLLAGTGNNQYSRGAGAYLTTDGGASWTRTLMSEPYNIEAVEFSTSNPSIAYAGNDQGIYRSEDGGHTWDWASGSSGSGCWGPPGVCAGFPIDFQVDPRNPDRLFANVYGGGNFLSINGGRTWKDASRGYTGALMRGLAVDPAVPARIFAVARSGIFVSPDGGASWQGLSFSPLLGLDWTALAVDPGNSQHILAETGWAGLGLSMDGGRSWRLVLMDPSNHMSVRAIAFSPSDPDTVIAAFGGFFNVGSWDSTFAGKGVYVSKDGGGSWSAANSGLAADANVASLVVDPTNGQVLHAATTNHGLLQSTDGARSWTQVSGGLPTSKPILAIALAPNNSKLMLAGLERGAAYRTTDGGRNWKRAASGLNPEATVTDIVFDPHQSGQVAYLSDLSSGVYRSVDGGLTWSALNQGLLSRAVNQLALSNDGLHLYAGTEGSGVYRLDLNGQPPAAVAAPEIQAQPTATTYSYQSPTPTSGASKGGNPLPPCGIGAILPLAFVGAMLRLRPKPPCTGHTLPTQSRRPTRKS